MRLFRAARKQLAALIEQLREAACFSINAASASGGSRVRRPSREFKGKALERPLDGRDLGEVGRRRPCRARSGKPARHGPRDEQAQGVAGRSKR